jgi:hypothetical protein
MAAAGKSEQIIFLPADRRRQAEAEAAITARSKKPIPL